MSPPPKDAEEVATKEKEAKDEAAMEAEVMKRWAQSWERVERALAQGDEYFLKKYPQFEGIPVLDEPYACAIWKIYEWDGSN
ncbi:hypothetical protein CEP52_006877 [Fusarium oligoseptatum]|uniref:Uncharacterized protein n=1 Tax=Fusarium oligoseptatum TaxID=2604345 RepID=A0A428TQG6_9HYPO|nr:hypothetical protein CEP52_006877 [Fusarium oligoseptatum]